MIARHPSSSPTTLFTRAYPGPSEARDGQDMFERLPPEVLPSTDFPATFRFPTFPLLFLSFPYFVRLFSIVLLFVSL